MRNKIVACRAEKYITVTFIPVRTQTSNISPFSNGRMMPVGTTCQTYLRIFIMYMIMFWYAFEVIYCDISMFMLLKLFLPRCMLHPCYIFICSCVCGTYGELNEWSFEKSTSCSGCVLYLNQTGLARIKHCGLYFMVWNGCLMNGTIQQYFLFWHVNLCKNVKLPIR